MAVEELDERVHRMDKGFYPTIEGVSMTIYAADGELVLLRGDKEHYTFEDIYAFYKGDPEYTKDYRGVSLTKFNDATISISQQDGVWTASVESQG